MPRFSRAGGGGGGMRVGPMVEECVRWLSMDANGAMLPQHRLALNRPAQVRLHAALHGLD